LRPLTFTRPLKSAGLQCAPNEKTWSVTFSIELHEREPFLGKSICAPARHSPYKAAYQIWSL